ncbi:serine/threonine-protein phosphatase 6 regulatory subunit 3-like isoform X1 [Hemiscyllium ocellatum]|uniref:serine/threonine-protein phosphatase 6 regulatory subunit 3-like isoform X1 n=1 Tax=Hemiscyllium ocellatum TaxID=170820 RepID=UPI0029661E6B|nr:serine/threonine-protein phosphatase 6 regulatory subunit 3-like isoform X1 [Hemiscyllium ocellatum]XP_060694871.1 serine/threonine-protein phosphatase 6 regulatory subunit 3-like isoform X1 [Hemiscyllium ocellatum]XP_060694873.1 serine/threonine-protein phosphatase 6 regulatory subunit 3-like isoform X1 [Hemiscyllium ocellatum]XP_060694874.1 serine/threonine-protein phosphatase 6 regulatory subunit 3-like isoform X1 [Hemiscyllium ocellatum]
MFWKFDLHTSSHIDTLLEKEDVTLTELMDEEDVLQECKAQNRKLLDFLVRSQSMEDLVTYITQEPPDDMDEKMKYKYPNISCELLTSDVAQLNDRLAEDEPLLTRLYSFLQNEPPLNPLLASFFSKVLSILISRKPDQIITFLRKRDAFVSLLLKHIGTSALMDLLLRLLTCVEPPQLRQDVLNWLNEEKIIQQLIEMVHPSNDEDRHSNASQSLCEIIRLSRDQMIQMQSSPEPDPLLSTLEKQETLEHLLASVLDREKTESAIVNCIQIFLTLLETRRPAFEGQLEICPTGMNHAAFSVSNSTLQAIRQRLKDFHQILLEPPKKSAMKTTWGILETPVGNTRLNVVRLVASLLQTNTLSINEELVELNTMDVLLEMYFRYIWNNFLHVQVEICIATILGSPPPHDNCTENNIEDNSNAARENILIKHLFTKCRLIQRILDAWENNEKEQSSGGRRRGYMGHLTRIANAIVHNAEKGPNSVLINQLLKDLSEDYRERWETFTTGSLAETNKKNAIDLVSAHNIHSSSDDEVDFKEPGFAPDSGLQQAFSDYQMQQMTSNFIDQFGFNDEEFADQEDIVNVPFERIADINFSLNTNESANVALFEACCKERIQQFDDSGSDEEDIWDEKDITFSQDAQNRHRSSGSTDSEESTDSEDEDADKRNNSFAPGACPDDRMEVDTNDAPGWTANFEVPMETANITTANSNETTLWSSGDSVPQETGWAMFSDFSSPLSSKDPLRSSSPVEMETSADPVDPHHNNLTHPEDFVATSQLVCKEQTAVSTALNVESTLFGEEEEVVTDQITETVTNGSMKETVSLTVDAKTETAVFKSEEVKLSTSEDLSSKYVLSENLETPKLTSPSQPGLKPSEGNMKSQAKDTLNGPVDNVTSMEEVKTNQQVLSPEASVNGPA